eukprot:GHRQ01002755.1.p1 GENE.GHRQ01002755.1~~GHRQ01002755.1.p1  ORF type:complete len:377 (+),score=93.13 GHRQ01002755.1:172-1302(+)
MRGPALLALALLLALGPAGCARHQGDLQTQLLLSSGLKGLLSDRSSLADPSVADLGLPEAAQEQRQGPLANPALHTVFAADSAIGRRAVQASLKRPEKSAGFDPSKAAKLAQLQSIAYCSALQDVATWNCTRCAQLPDFQPHLVHFDASWDLLGYAGYWPSMQAKVLVFRGTDSSSWYNWAENMRAWRTDATYPVDGAPPALRLHSGFLILWNSSSMAKTFHAAFGELQKLHPQGPTYVLGHSMGGALAHLAALDLQIMYHLQDVRVYTFGSPRVGNSVFAEFFAQKVSESWRFTHGRDIVPSVPPQLLGFRHVSREVWLVDVDGGAAGVEQHIVVCDDSGEDPSCHNAACRLGLCTSVADHLMYMGAHMYRGGEC